MKPRLLNYFAIFSLIVTNAVAQITTGSFNETMSVATPPAPFSVFFSGQASLGSKVTATQNFAISTSPGNPAFGVPANARALDFSNNASSVRTEYAFNTVNSTILGLTEGSGIDNSLNWVFSPSGGDIWTATGTGDWASGESKFMAFRLDVNEDSTNYHYGWIQFTIAGDGSSITVGDWAYNSTINELITTPIPESSTFALGLGILAIGCVLWMRNKQADSLTENHY